MFRHLILSCVLLGSFCCGVVHSQESREKMPREDVVDVPAIGEGLCVSNVFQTNMVLQRDKPVNVWGWAEPGEKVTVSFAGQRVEAKAAEDRSWTVTLEPMPADSTPQTMKIEGESASTDAGEHPRRRRLDPGRPEQHGIRTQQGRRRRTGDRFGELPANPAVDACRRARASIPSRALNVLHEWSSWSSRHFRKGDWDVCSPETVKEFSAIGYVFGRRLHMATQVPIGLIDASIGGTTVETWTPDAVLRKIEGRETKDKLQEWEDKIASYDAAGRPAAADRQL